MTTNLGVSHRGLNDKSLQWKPRHARRKDPARFADMGLDNIIVAREQRQRLSSARTQFRAILHKRRSVNSLEEARDLRRKGLTKKFSNTVVETNEERDHTFNGRLGGWYSGKGNHVSEGSQTAPFCCLEQ